MGADALYEFDWDSEDDREMESFSMPASKSLVVPGAMVTSAKESMMAGSSGSKVRDNFIRMGFDEKLVAEAIEEHGEQNEDSLLEVLLKHSMSSSASPPTSDMPSSSATSPTSKMINHFIGMGFAEEQVSKAIKENVDGDVDSILETLLTFQAIAESPQEVPPQFPEIDSDPISSEYDEHFLSDIDSSEDEEIIKLEPGDEEIVKLEPGDDSRLTTLRMMGYSSAEASIAIQRCGPEATIVEIVDFLHVAVMAKQDPTFYAEEVKPKLSTLSKHRKRGLCEDDTLNRRKQVRVGNDDEETLRLPNPMVGFGLPNDFDFIPDRHLPQAAVGPPFFYYENVALAPKGVWQTISRFLYDVEPEFVDSKFFCAAARKRGYVHNLPIRNRYPLLPLPPQTIHEALPMTSKWWPSWDQRTKLNCLQTSIASAKLTERIRKSIERYEGDPPLEIQKRVLEECRKWNLVWVGKNKLAPLEPDEFEMLLGFPKNHTRGGGISRTDRFKSLGNSFQVDTVAYHLSTLKDVFPEGLNLLSLFSGIGGAEVALHRLGIRLKNVVSVEISEVNRGIQSCWWEQTNQTGNLVHISDIQQLTAERLEHLMASFGGFDLVVGGSPCNNLAGSNRHHRDGLEGRESSLFYDYFRLLDVIKNSQIYNR